MGKFKRQADLMIEDIYGLFNRALRLSLRAAVRAAVDATHHDSSNAAYHWLIGERQYSRPASRREGLVRDLRARKGGRWTLAGKSAARPGVGTVGAKGDAGRRAYATQIHVVRRESEVIDKYVMGRSPSRQFYLYHGLIDGRLEGGAGGAAIYKNRANIDAAGAAGRAAFTAAMERYMRDGQVRRGRR